jgi:uncharacterized protein with PIN domain
MSMDPWPRLVADVMLGRLARWLRLAGLDVAYDPSWDDDHLLRRAVQEQRILLTRDRPLYQRARRMNVPALFVRSDRLTDQFPEVCRDLGLDPDGLPWFARCALCNERIQPIRRDLVRHVVPDYVWRHHRQFYRCPACDRIYWAGSHYRRMMGLRARWARSTGPSP